MRADQTASGIFGQLARLSRAAWIVGAVWLFLILLMLTERISTGEGVVFGVALLAFALMLPRPQLAAQVVANEPDNSHANQVAYSVCDAIVAPGFVLDWKASILHRNAAAATELPHAAQGSPISFAIRQPALHDAIERVQTTGEPQQVELKQTGLTTVWYVITIAPILPPGAADLDADQLGPEQHRLLMVLDNQSEQRRAEAMRVDFIANASHELRTPLTSVVGFIDTLLGPAADDPQAREKFLKIMRTQADRMSNLIDDLLSLSRIELRQHIRPTDEVNLVSVIGEVVENLQNQIADAQVELNVLLVADTVCVPGDREELYEITQNLLDNAIKYGADGGKIDVKLAWIDDQLDYDVALDIIDYGVGVPQEHVPRLTERFYRVDAETSRKKKGTGLGLAIVKHIVSRHRGEMRITSTPEQGTHVRVLLPSNTQSTF